MNARMCLSVWVTRVIYGCLCDSTMKNAENSNFVKNDSNEGRAGESEMKEDETRTKHQQQQQKKKTPQENNGHRGA